MKSTKLHDSVSTALFSHAKFDRAYEAMLVYFLRTRPGRVVLLTGPTGTGKSLITKTLERSHPSYKINGIEIRPVLRLSAQNYMDKGYFSIRELVIDALEKIGHPLLSTMISDRARTTSRMIKALAKELIRLQTRFFIIDEAQHIRLVQGGDRNATKILDALKSFAEETGVVLVLSGAYPLLNTIELGAQLSRRTHRVVMHRYFPDREGDLQEFTKIVKFCAENIGLSFNECVEPLLPDIYHSSYGIYGIVEQLMDAIEIQLEARGIQSPDVELVRKLVRKNAITDSIREETVAGEDYLKNLEQGRNLTFGPKIKGHLVKRKKKAARKKVHVRDYSRDGS